MISGSGSPSASAYPAAEPGYWIVGPAAWREAMRPILVGRQALGRPADYMAIESLLVAFPGFEDPAASLREALRYAHSVGVSYALLLGDAHHLPVRYASDVRAVDPPTLDQLQICDLYFGEFDGDWDRDGDGVYGEPVDDDADIAAEIYVGRVPVATATEAAAWAAKWDRYVFARGDIAYLGRALGIAADQMRDEDSGVGQAAIVGRRLPGEFQQDTTSLLEAPAGYVSDPTGPWAAGVVALWDRGWGITHLYAHGRWDGFAVKTAAYNNWPKSYLLTAPDAASPHASLTELTGPAGVVYSIACNQASFDADTALLAAPGQRCVAAELLANPDGGAVAFVGYSRWGWVYTSYRVAATFWEGVFDSAYTLGQALNLTRLRFPYLRDVAYGHNVYGDPALHVWRGEPQRIEADAPGWVSAAGDRLPVRLISAAALPATVTLVTTDGELLASAVMSTFDSTVLTVPPLEPQPLLLTVSAAGLAPHQDTVYSSLALGVDDETPRPSEFSLGNYPNPFNAETRIVFSVPAGRSARLEIFNTLGMRVRSWQIDAGAGGDRSVTWDGCGDAHAVLPSGVYIARLHAGDGTTVTHRLLLLK